MPFLPRSPAADRPRPFLPKPRGQGAGAALAPVLAVRGAAGAQGAPAFTVAEQPAAP